MSLLPRIGRYEVVAELGRGGAAVVYRAFDRALEREVAIKLLLASTGANATQLQRFAREARALARIRHPGIVSVLQLEELPGEGPGAPARPYLVLELVDGDSLQERLVRAGRLPPREAVAIARDVAAALAVAHAASVIHRDVKPDNILLARPDDRPMLTDFGVAKDLGGAEDASLSRSGFFLGTPGYWAPEQAAGRHDDVGPATDVHAVGATLYALLTGAPPFAGETLMDAVSLTLTRAPEPPSARAPGIDAALDAICLRCLAKAPDARYPSAQALGADLDRWLARGERRRFGRTRAPRERGAGRRRAAPAPGRRGARRRRGCRGARRAGGRRRDGGGHRSGGSAAPARRARGGRAAASESSGRLERRAGRARRPAVVAPAIAQRDRATATGEPLAWENGIGMRFVLVPPGTFTMGSPDDEPHRRNDETPHEVTLTRSCWISATEVTNAQFRRFRPAHRSGEAHGLSLDGDEQPVVMVSWYGAIAFCEWLSDQAGVPGLYRLPTEAEWECAARAGTTSAVHWGDDARDIERWENTADASARRVWSAEPGHDEARDGPRFADGDDGYPVAAPVGSYRPNPWGLFDVLGNAWEWTGDRYDAYPPGPATDPTGPEASPVGTCVLRGGGWSGMPWRWFRSAGRDGGRPPTDEVDCLGFRVCATRFVPSGR